MTHVALVRAPRSASPRALDLDYQLATVFRVLAVPDLAGPRVILGGELAEDSMEAPSLVLRHLEASVLANIESAFHGFEDENKSGQED